MECEEIYFNTSKNPTSESVPPITAAINVVQSLTNLSGPVIKDFLGVQLEPERITITLQFLSLNMTLPALSQDIFNTPHICCQLSVNLLGPDNGTRHWRQITYMTHTTALALRVLHLYTNKTIM